MKIQLKNAVLVASVLLSTSAFADAMFSTGGYARELHKMDMMKMLDADGNHMVSRAEADSFYGLLFDALDTDKNGTIDAKEWVGTKGNQSISLATGGFSRELRTMAMMKLVDTDTDHTVSKQEFLKLNETQFSAMDKSEDGQLDPQEWLAKQTGNKK
jgi:Ca2+-binding EF-hand superfamily protein